MQLILPWRRGQYKPYGSIPRINWQHPLAYGLVSYNYDTGGGPVIDLVSGGAGAISTPGGGTTISPKPSFFGSGLRYNGNSGNDSTTNMPPNAQLVNLQASTPYCFAMAFQQAATPPQQTIMTTIDTSQTNQGFQIQVNSSITELFIIYAGSTSGDARLIARTNSNSVGVFHTVVANATTSTSGNLYTDGQFDQSFTGQATTVSGTPQQLVLNGAFWKNLSQTGGVNGFVYYAAFWNRNLTANEAFELHTNPYAPGGIPLLIYPEDEIAALMVGTAGAFTWLEMTEEGHRLPTRHWVREMMRHD